MNDYEHCILCKDKLEQGQFGNKALKCPNANNWRRVIDSKMPQINGYEKAREVVGTLNSLGVPSSGCHQSFLKDKPNTYVVRISSIENAFRRLMKHQPVDCAMFHESKFMCKECVIKLRIASYDGGDTVPEIKCPVCKTVLIPI